MGVIGAIDLAKELVELKLPCIRCPRRAWGVSGSGAKPDEGGSGRFLALLAVRLEENDSVARVEIATPMSPHFSYIAFS